MRLLLTAALLLCASTAHGSMIVNGDFSAPYPPPGGVLQGWTLGGFPMGKIDGYNGVAYNRPIFNFGWVLADSVNVNIPGVKAFPFEPSLSQTFTADAGETIRFDLRVDAGSDDEDGYGSVFVSVSEPTEDGYLLEVTNWWSEDWTSYAYQFQESGTHTIKIWADASFTANGGHADGSIDNVRIDPVPEPATWGLLLIGLSVLALAKRASG